MYMYPRGLTKTRIPFKVPQDFFLLHAYVKDCVMPDIFLRYVVSFREGRQVKLGVLADGLAGCAKCGKPFT